MTINKEAIIAGNQEQIDQLLRMAFCPANADFRQVIPEGLRHSLAENLHDELLPEGEWHENVRHWLSTHEGKGLSVPVPLRAEVELGLKIGETWARLIEIDDSLKAHLLNLRVPLLARAMLQPGFWFSSGPLLQITDYLYEQMLGWEQSLGEQGRELANIFTGAIDKLLQLPPNDNAGIERIRNQLATEFGRANSVFAEQFNAMKEQETENFRFSQAEKLVIDFLNHFTADKRLPPYIINFLHGKFIGDMQDLILNRGADGYFWQKWKVLIEAMLDIYQAGGMLIDDLNIKNQLLRIAKDMEKLLEDCHIESEEFDDFISQLAYDINQMVSGKDIDGMVSVPVIQVISAYGNIDTHVTKSLLARACEYPEGQWFLYRNDDGKDVRCQLFLQLGKQEQVVFASLTGQKVLSVSYKDFAYLLSAKHMRPLLQWGLFKEAISQTIGQLVTENEGKEDRSQAIEKEAQEKRRAAEKAKTEAMQLAQRKSDENPASMLGQIADEMKREARLALNSLALGAWVELMDANTREYRRVKLAVKYNATGRFVFVDAEGATVAEHMRDELIDMVLYKKFKFLETDTYFADRLSKIVKTIRNN